MALSHEVLDLDEGRWDDKKNNFSLPGPGKMLVITVGEHKFYFKEGIKDGIA